MFPAPPRSVENSLGDLKMGGLLRLVHHDEAWRHPRREHPQERLAVGPRVQGAASVSRPDMGSSYTPSGGRLGGCNCGARRSPSGRRTSAGPGGDRGCALVAGLAVNDARCRHRPAARGEEVGGGAFLRRADEDGVASHRAGPLAQTLDHDARPGDRPLRSPARPRAARRRRGRALGARSRRPRPTHTPARKAAAAQG